MGGQRKDRSATAILVLLSGSICSATIYTLDPDGIINPTASPAPVLPPWRWTAEDEGPVSRDPRPRPTPPSPPPRRPPFRRPPPQRQPPVRPPIPPRGNTFRARRPTWPQPETEFPDSWKEALRRAAFQSLRNGAGALLGYRGITPSIQDDADKELWQRLSVAEFVGARDGYPGQGGEQPDVSTLAEGLLIHKEGELLFFVSDGVSSCPCENARTLATWSIRRLRHSGPGREQPQYQLHFSVIPVVDDQQIEIEPDREESFRHNPSPLYRGIPIFTRNGPKEYNPRFIEEYGSVVSAFLRQRDSLPKYQTIKENKDQSNTPPRQRFPAHIHDPRDPQQQYQSPAQDEFQIPTREEYSEPPREEYRVSLTEEYPETQQEKFRELQRQNYRQNFDDEHYPSYQPEDESIEEFHQHYDGSQANSRRQQVRFYRQRYTSYPIHEETRQQYFHQYRDQSASFTGFHKPSQELNVFRPSAPFERFSELDPLYQNNKPTDQKALSQGIVTKQKPVSQVSLIPVQTVHSVELPIENIFRSYWQNSDDTSTSPNKQSEKNKNDPRLVSYGDWTTINTQTKEVGTKNNFDSKSNLPGIQLQAPKRNAYNETFSRQSHFKIQNEQKRDSYPIASQSLSALTRVTEHLSQTFNNESASSVKTKVTSWNERLRSSTDPNSKSASKSDY